LARLFFDRLEIKDGANAQLEATRKTIGIALGGREAYRIYQAWDKVIAQLLNLSPGARFVLLGTENAEEPAARILKRFPSADIKSYVNRLQLAETGRIIGDCCLLLCADGGLLHVASALGTPTVCLFAQEYPEFRYVPADRFRALRAERDVNAIAADEVAGEVGYALVGQWQVWDGDSLLSSPEKRIDVR
jgi:heptosyltransferase-2